MRNMECPKCGANIVEREGEFVFCPYCGTKMDLYDKRIRYEKEIKVHQVNEDIAAIKRAENQRLSEENRHKEEVAKQNSLFTENKMPIIFMGIVFGSMLLLAVILSARDYFVSNRNYRQAVEEGLISAGEYREYLGMSYEAAAETLRLKGFTNISVVDLDDASIFSKDRKKDTVGSVSIAGNNRFESYDYFKPNDIVIIQYH